MEFQKVGVSKVRRGSLGGGGQSRVSYPSEGRWTSRGPSPGRGAGSETRPGTRRCHGGWAAPCRGGGSECYPVKSETNSFSRSPSVPTQPFSTRVDLEVAGTGGGRIVDECVGNQKSDEPRVAHLPRCSSVSPNCVTLCHPFISHPFVPVIHRTDRCLNFSECEASKAPHACGWPRTRTARCRTSC